MTVTRVAAEPVLHPASTDTAEAEAAETEAAETDAADAVPVVGSLSPSRAGDFMTCPLLYRFRTVDKLPERPSPASTRGSVVHAVLDRLFDLPPAERSPAAATRLVEPEWRRLCDEEPALAELFPDAAGLQAWLGTVREMLAGYFALEDPRRLEPAEREHYVEALLPSGLRLRGYIDRLDRAVTGEERIVDYKTGRVPGELFEAAALFQLKFYALVLWQTRGVVPSLLQLMYLGDREMLRYRPDEADLRATERKVDALWRAIRRATETGDFRPRPSRLCDCCEHRSLCPAHGGSLPPLPDRSDRSDDLPARAPRDDRRCGQR